MSDLVVPLTKLKSYVLFCSVPSNTAAGKLKNHLYWESLTHLKKTCSAILHHTKSKTPRCSPTLLHFTTITMLNLNPPSLRLRFSATSEFHKSQSVLQQSSSLSAPITATTTAQSVEAEQTSKGKRKDKKPTDTEAAMFNHNQPSASSTAVPGGGGDNLAAMAMQNSIQQQQIVEMQNTIAAQQR